MASARSRRPRTLPPALLLNGGPTAVAIARSLARQGVFVHAFGHRLDPVRASRACGAFVDLGNGEGVQERWLARLDGRYAAGAVLLPSTDEGLELVARHRDTLVERGYRPIEADDEVVLALLDKVRTYELAAAAGVRSPRHAVVEPGDDVERVASRIGFPLALKPRQSHLFARHFGLRQKVFVVRDVPELVAAHERFEALDLAVLATEIVPGPDDSYHSYYTYVDERGEPLFDLTKHKLRQFNPGFGLATLHQVDRHARTIELGRRFVTGLGVRGLACVEFKVDVRDGDLTLIECNARFTAGHEIVRHAGIDLGLLAYNRVAGLPDPPLDRYREGVRMWHPIEDVRGFVVYRRRGELTFSAWLGSLLHRQHFPMFSWRDPLPTLFSLSRGLIRQVIRRPSPDPGRDSRALPSGQEVSAETTASATSPVLDAAVSSLPGRRS